MEIWLKYSLWLSQYDGLSDMSVGISLMFKRQIEEEADEKEEAEEFGCGAQRSRSPQPSYRSNPCNHISGMLWGALFKWETTMSVWGSAPCPSAVRDVCELKHVFFKAHIYL